MSASVAALKISNDTFEIINREFVSKQNEIIERA
jgi:hypothetical protein